MPLASINRTNETLSVVLALLLISGVINILALSGAFYMLQVYDRVLSSHNVETLVALSILVAGLYLALGLLDALRSQILLRFGTKFDTAMMPRAYTASARAAMLSSAAPQSAQPVRDVDTVRAFLAGPAPVALLDLPWTPVFFVFVWVLSPSLGILTLCGLILIVLLAWVADVATRRLEQSAIASASDRVQVLSASLQTSEAASAMGFGPEAAHRFLSANAKLREAQNGASDIVSALASLSKVVRLLLQSAILGLGAYYAILGDLSSGAIIAASIAATRALAPAEQAIANWRTFSATRASYQQLIAAVASVEPELRQIEIPPPTQSISAEKISVFFGGAGRLALNGVSITLTSGQALAVVGKSGSGKSTLARALVGVVPLSRGTIRLDGAPIERWSLPDRGQFIGYMPQQTELFPGTIAENIARLDEQPDSRAVIDAAVAAGLHDIILQLPLGYETVIGPGGTPLSAGQRQQLGLARAIYGDPFLIVLDEPNANIDSDAEVALISALTKARARGAIVVVVAHRRSLVAACNLVAIMEDGFLKAFGPKNEVLDTPVSSVRRARTETSGPTNRRADNSIRTNA